jgi:hypothetical protein
MTHHAHFVRASCVIGRILGCSIHPFLVAGETISMSFLGMRNLGRTALVRRIRLCDEIASAQGDHESGECK